MKKIYLLLVSAVFIAGPLSAQFVITPDTNTTQLVNDFILTGVTASNVVYTGAANTLGSFINGSMTDIGLDEGIFMTTGDITATPSVGSPVSEFACTDNSGLGDPLLESLIPGFTTYNASILEFDLVPVGNVLEFQYVFASEEYPEYVGSSFNDVFGFFISGQNPAGGNYIDSNIAIIPGTNLPVAINNVNAGLNASYFVDNETLGGQTIVFDGFTTVLLVHSYVVPSASYHLKMAIADAGDGVFDSGIFLKAQSMKSYNETTGIDEQQSCAFNIYPNPVKDKIKIPLSEASQIEILNFQGQVIACMNENEDHASIDLSGFTKGIYFVRVKTDNGVSVLKFIKE